MHYLKTERKEAILTIEDPGNWVFNVLRRFDQNKSIESQQS